MAGGYELQQISFSNMLKNIMQHDPKNVNSMFELETGISGTYHEFKKVSSVPDVQTKTTRNEVTVRSGHEFTARRVYLTENYMAEFIDKTDKILSQIDPTSTIIQNYARKLRRKRLAKCVTAGLGDAQQGKDTVVNVPLPETQKIAVGATGLTLAKIEELSLLINSGLDGDEQEIYCIIGEKQRRDLLKIEQVVNKDYNNGTSPLVSGKPINFYGINWIPIGVGDGILPKSGTTRSIIAFTKGAIGLAIGAEIDTTIDRMPDYNNSIQIRSGILDNAVRIYDDQVVQIDCKE